MATERSLSSPDLPIGDAEPLNRLDRAWTNLERRVAVFVVVLEVATLIGWVSLKGLSSGPSGTIGAIFRATSGAILLGCVAFFGARRAGANPRAQTISALAGIGIGAFLGPMIDGSDWASNVVGWMQNASVFALIGGPRGLVTRLTLWLALLGASMAASAGKHISIDIATRYLPEVTRRPAALLSLIVGAAVCMTASWGFTDSIAVTKFRAEAFRACAEGEVSESGLCETKAGDRLRLVAASMGTDAFLLGQQLSLDVKTGPSVLSGVPYAETLSAKEWNAWLHEGGWAERYSEEGVRHLAVPETEGAMKIPMVEDPSTGSSRNGLIRDLDFILPFGLLMMALKLLLRAIRLAKGELRGGLDAHGAPLESGPMSSVVKGSFAGVGAIIAVITATLGWLPGLVAVLALLGAPLFVIMGGAAQLAWLTHLEAEYRHLRFIAPTVLDTHFSDSPILVTIPLFTFVGYLLAEARTPDRLVLAARSVLGWLPGGLAIVAVVASAVFTLLTGGSGVTIIAIGGLLYPALRKQNYSESFSLGLVTTGGSVGLLLPYSLPLLIFALVAHVDFLKAFKAVLVPGALVILLLALYSAYVGRKEKIERETPTLENITTSVWTLKWELMIPVILIIALGTGLASIDEAAGLVAGYTLIVELFVYRDLSVKKDLGRIVKSSMSMAGAIIIILSMANALMNYVVDQRIPTQILELMLGVGIERRWEFLIVMNIFLLVLGMIMEGFSAIFVAVPLILPFVAEMGMRDPNEAMSPFQLGMIFILNLELAYCLPPLGLNLFIASFRFERPVASLYRVVLPFAGIITVALLLVSYVPWLSDVAIKGDIAELKALAAKDGLPPRDAWMLECVQADPNDPQPCTQEERDKFGPKPVEAAPEEPAAVPAEDCNPDFGPCPPAKAAPPEDCNPDFGPCPPAKAAPPEDCNPDFGPCPPTKAT
ncbi:MAG: TRAP transporter large permease subunit [Deltaproteobacteria bacterium]|nr:TRAP transporter large permease subunit [Deltaproteobacteria bacterium]